MSKYFLFLFLFLFQLSKAQFCKEQASFSASNIQNLNSLFLQQHKIKRVVITHAVKEDVQRIKDLEIVEAIYFDTLGHVVKKMLTTKTDTSETYYYYLSRNLSIIRAFHSKDISSIYYSYDSLQNKIKEVHCKEENSGASKEFFKLLKQQIDWSETYTYQQLNEKQQRRKTFNDIGALYKEAIVYHNEKGLLMEENERYSVTGVSQNYKNSYDTVGNLVERIFLTDVVGELEEKSTFTYDIKGNISGEKFFRNGKLLSEKIYFYDAKNEILQAILTKYPDRKTIEMQNFQVEYF